MSKFNLAVGQLHAYTGLAQPRVGNPPMIWHSPKLYVRSPVPNFRLHAVRLTEYSKQHAQHCRIVVQPHVGRHWRLLSERFGE